MSYSVGVYIPTKNRLALLKKALGSVLAQTYENIKVCVVDDGSTDDTYEYLKQLNDPRVQVIRNEQSIGACAARNKAIASLDTDLVTGLDDDDVFLPERIEELVNVYDDKYSFICSGYIWDYGVHKKSLFTSDKVISLPDALDLNQCSNQALVKRERILSIGGFDKDLPALQDHDMWVRLIAKYGDAYRLGRALYIVNDDQELERISSVNNKVRAIDIFLDKHKSIMSENNRINFYFYRKKILEQKFTLKELLSTSKAGLKSLKVRYFLANRFSNIANARLYMLRGNSHSQSLMSKLLPLVATASPGGVRLVLAMSIAFIYGADGNQALTDFATVIAVAVLFTSGTAMKLLKVGTRDKDNGTILSGGVACALGSMVLWVGQYAGAISNHFSVLLLLLGVFAYQNIRALLIRTSSFTAVLMLEVLILIGTGLYFLALEAQKPESLLIAYALSLFTLFVFHFIRTCYSLSSGITYFILSLRETLYLGGVNFISTGVAWLMPMVGSFLFLQEQAFIVASLTYLIGAFGVVSRYLINKNIERVNNLVRDKDWESKKQLRGQIKKALFLLALPFYLFAFVMTKFSLGDIGFQSLAVAALVLSCFLISQLSILEFLILTFIDRASLSLRSNLVYAALFLVCVATLFFIKEYSAFPDMYLIYIFYILNCFFYYIRNKAVGSALSKEVEHHA